MGGESEQPHQTFTPAEANAILPKVIPLVKQLQALYRSIARTNQEMDDVITKLSAGNGYPIRSLKERLEALTKHQLQLVEAFQSVLKQMEELGALVKDVQKGLVDFYSLRNEQPVFLCWVLGEERVGFWHTLEDGFAGRQRLE